MTKSYPSRRKRPLPQTLSPAKAVAETGEPDAATGAMIASSVAFSMPGSIVGASSEAWKNQGPDARRIIAASLFELLDKALLEAWRMLDHVRKDLHSVGHKELVLDKRIQMRTTVSRMRSWIDMVRIYSSGKPLEDEEEFFVPEEAREELRTLATNGSYVALALREVLDEHGPPPDLTGRLQMTRDEFIQRLGLPPITDRESWGFGKDVPRIKAKVQGTRGNYRLFGSKTTDNLAGQDSSGEFWVKHTSKGQALYLRNPGKRKAP